jgi:hypothetical protein
MKIVDGRPFKARVNLQKKIIPRRHLVDLLLLHSEPLGRGRRSAVWR